MIYLFIPQSVGMGVLIVLAIIVCVCAAFLKINCPDCGAKCKEQWYDDCYGGKSYWECTNCSNIIEENVYPKQYKCNSKNKITGVDKTLDPFYPYEIGGEG